MADILISKRLGFEFEPLQFWWSKQHGIVAIDPPYTPDFLLDIKYGDKKVLLEPHGVWDEVEDYLGKLRVFKMNYGQFFFLVLIVPESFAQHIRKTDPKQESYDQLWTIEEFPKRLLELTKESRKH